MTRSRHLGAAAIIIALGAGTAHAQTPTTTGAAPITVGTLASMCASATSAESPLTAFCRGVMVGAGQYHTAVSTATGRRVFCLPTPTPTIDQVQAAFVQWARTNTQYSQDLAVDGLMRFAASAYPCPPAPAAPAAARSR